jgi:hypothetical protein
MQVFTVVRNNIEIHVRKLKVKELKPNKIKSQKWVDEHHLTPESYVLVTCKSDGRIPLEHPKQKYKIHKIQKDDNLDEIPNYNELLYEDYLSFPIVDYIEEKMFE